MNDDDLGAHLRGALHDLGERPAPAPTLDAARLRRRGDDRRLRRQAATASLASAMVFVVAIGTVYYAAHRSRTRVTVDSQLAIPEYVARSASPYTALTSGPGAYTSQLTILSAPPTVHAIAGQLTTVRYAIAGDDDAELTRISYGDGSQTDACATPLDQPRTFTHTWTTPGRYTYRLQADEGCPASDPVTITGTVIVAAPVRSVPGSTLLPAVP